MLCDSSPTVNINRGSLEAKFRLENTTGCSSLTHTLPPHHPHPGPMGLTPSAVKHRNNLERRVQSPGQSPSTPPTIPDAISPPITMGTAVWEPAGPARLTKIDRGKEKKKPASEAEMETEEYLLGGLALPVSGLSQAGSLTPACMHLGPPMGESVLHSSHPAQPGAPEHTHSQSLITSARPTVAEALPAIAYPRSQD
ncbi:hypothetical protein SRHO_G00219820 [Serrasalmus rhombeus]